MVYKRYIKRKGKLCGPYYYESYRGEDGKVHSRYLANYKPKKNHKKLFLILGIVFGIFILLLAGNINYSLTGKVVSNVTEVDLEIAGKMAEKKLVSSKDIREHIGLNVKQGIFEENKVMEFDLPEGKVELEFDLLDYGSWEESDVESEVEAENFDILVEESSEKYKWGYDIKLNDLNFMARIDVKSSDNIKIIDNQTLKIGNSYISFSDLADEGYSLSVDSPVVLSEVNVSLDELNVSEVNVSEMNVTEIVVNESEIDTGENITSIVNESLPEVIGNISEEINITLPEENIIQEINETIETNLSEELESEIDEIDIEEVEVEDVEIEVEDVEIEVEDVEDVEQPIEEKENDEGDVVGITGNIIRGLTGFVVNGFGGITGFAVQEQRTVSIYIQRDFSLRDDSGEPNGTNVSVGDMINLDPFIIILISKAEHLDENRGFVSDIYDEVKEKDGNWSEIIGGGEYVRVTFEENLTMDKDITLFARGVGGNAQIEVYRKEGNEVIALFENISEENWYKIYLTNLGVEVNEDVFDLKVLGSVEFDYIVDPVGDNGTATDGNTVFRCGTITESGVFVMNQSITNNSLTGDCINITVANVELNCNGSYISSNGSYTGIYSDQLNTTIRNCNISVGAGSGGYGIELNNANNSYVYNNTLNEQNRGLYLFSTNNSIIENNTVNLNSYGIYILESLNNNLTNNTVNSNSNEGIYIIDSLSHTLTNNIANNNIKDGIELAEWVVGEDLINEGHILTNNIANNNSDSGIVISRVDYSILTNNTANLNGDNGITNINGYNNNLTNNTLNSNAWGISLSGPSNILLNNNIWNCTDSSYGCLNLWSSENNVISGGIINLSAGYLIHMESDLTPGDNNRFIDIQLIGATLNDTYLFGNTINHTFLNCSYNSSKEYVETGSELIRKWYYQAYVNDTSGNAVSGADVLGYNVSGSLDFNATTNSSGWINKTEVTEYVNSGGTKSYYSLYSVNARNSSYADGIVSTNISGNLLNDTITMSEVAGCGWLTSSGTYSQSQNIIDNGLLHDCINITAQNVTFDGKGFYISSNVSVSGIYSNQLNTTIRNCNVSIIPSGYGIKFVSANNSYVYNNTLNEQSRGLFFSLTSNTKIINNTLNSNNDGIYLASNSNHNQITNNTVNSNTYGIFLHTSSNNTISNITANSNDIGIDFAVSSNNSLTDNTVNSNRVGIYLVSSSNNNLTNNNIWNCTTTNLGGLYLNDADNNTISGGIINLSSNDLIRFITNSDNNKFSDIQLIGATTNDTYVTGTSVNNTFLNVSYDNTKEYVETGSELIRKWYYQAYVNDTSGNDFADANVTGFNSTGDYVFNLTANASGWTSIGEIIDYVNFGGTKNYYSNYTIYARNASLSTDSHTYNVSLELNNLADSFEIDNIDPVVSLRDIPSSTSSTTINYNYNVTDNSSVSSCSLILGGAVVASDTDVNNSGANETITYTTSAGTHIYYVSCNDSALNVGNSSSGTIVVISTTTTVVTSGGGGGGTSIRTISLKIEFPSDFSEEPGKIEVPITINNNGQTNLRGVSLTSHILKDFELSDVRTEFNQSSFDSISAGEKENVVLTAYADLDAMSLYELVVNVSSTTPAYNTDNSLILNLAGANVTTVQKMIVFTEDMIVGNAECLELKEMVEDAQKSFEQGDFEGAILKSRTAVEACKEYISGVQQPIYAEKPKLDFSIYLIIGVIVAVLFGIIFNLVKVIIFRKKGGKRKV